MFSMNGRQWHILMVAPNHYKLRRSDGSYSVGSCDNDTGTIYLNEYLDGAFLRKVICHELTHAAMFSYGVQLNLDQEEILADLIASYGDEIMFITDKIFKKIREIPA